MNSNLNNNISIMNSNTNNNMINNNMINNNMMNMNMFNMMNNNMMNNNMFNMMNMNMFNMMNNNMFNMMNNIDNRKEEKIKENKNALSSIIKKMQNLQDNLSKKMVMNNSLEKLFNLLDVNIIIMDCMIEFQKMIENNKWLMINLIDNLLDNRINVQNNIYNKDSIRICFNNKIEKYLLDKSKPNNNNNNLISRCFNQFLEHKNKYESLVLSFINDNITTNNDGFIYTIVFEEENGKKYSLYCKSEETFSDLFIRYKIIKGCTDKNYSFYSSMNILKPEQKVQNLSRIKVIENN